MVDTNVHFEDSVRLTQRLIELGKRDWWLVPFPVEDHGFTRPDRGPMSILESSTCSRPVWPNAGWPPRMPGSTSR